MLARSSKQKTGFAEKLKQVFLSLRISLIHETGPYSRSSLQPCWLSKVERCRQQTRTVSPVADPFQASVHNPPFVLALTHLALNRPTLPTSLLGIPLRKVLRLLLIPRPVRLVLLGDLCLDRVVGIRLLEQLSRELEHS